MLRHDDDALSIILVLRIRASGSARARLPELGISRCGGPPLVVVPRRGTPLVTCCINPLRGHSIHSQGHVKVLGTPFGELNISLILAKRSATMNGFEMTESCTRISTILYVPILNLTIPLSSAFCICSCLAFAVIARISTCLMIFPAS